MYGCKSWTIKKAECQRIDAFELWCWRRLLRVPGLQGEPASPSWRKSVLNVHWKGWCWSWNSNTLATCCEELTHWKRPWCWERLKAGEEGDNRGWNGWMASLTQWTWVWVSSVNWWWTGKPGVLQSMGLQRVRHDWATELNWTDGMDGSHIALWDGNRSSRETRSVTGQQQIPWYYLNLATPLDVTLTAKHIYSCGPKMPSARCLLLASVFLTNILTFGEILKGHFPGVIFSFIFVRFTYICSFWPRA